MSERKKVPGAAGDAAKAERLAAALRANLKRRKTQARALSQPDQAARGADETPEDQRKTGEE
jgi:hypothetical protein